MSTQASTPQAPASATPATAAETPATVTAQPTAKPQQPDPNASNPSLSTDQSGKKKTLQEKVMENAQKVFERQAQEKAGKGRGKTSAIINPDDTRNPSDIKSADTTAQNPSKKAPARKTEVTADGKTVLPPDIEAAAAAASNAVVGDDQDPAEIAAVVPGEEAAAAAAAADGAEDKWEPNFKFKFKKFDPASRSGVPTESEIPEEFRGLIKDAASEAKVRDLFERAEGFEFVKQGRERLRGDRDQAVNHIKDIHGRIQNLDALINSQNLGDLDQAFQTMNLPQEKVLQWVLDKINYSQLEPGQRQLIDGQREADRRAKMLEQQNRALSENTMKAVTSAKGMALDAILARPDLETVVAAYDNRPGRKPADPSFRDLVINHGELSWHRSGGRVDLSPVEAVEAVLRDYGIEAAYRGQNTARPAQPQAQPQNNTAQAAPAAQQRQAQQQLPNAVGRAASPTQPRITNKKDLLAYRKQVLGS